MTDGRLDSWKEIAAYLRRDVRTVQRWERREGLPVHRHQHEQLGSIYAFIEEIDAWQVSRRGVTQPLPAGAAANPPATTATNADRERRLVVVLAVAFPRLDALAESLPAAAWLTLQSRLATAVEQAIGAQGGHVVRQSATGAVGCFGLSGTSEDDAPRAAAAGHAVIEAARADGRVGERREAIVSVGLEAGPVTARGLDVVGEAIGIAEALAAAGAPGEVLAGPGTWRLLAPFFRSADGPVTTVHGRDVASRRVSERLGFRTRLEASLVSGLTPFVGRARELSLLQEHTATLTGGGNVLQLLGEPGVGKSRLLLELQRRLSAHGVRVLTGRATQRSSTPYAALIDALADALGVSTRTPESVDAQLEAALSAVHPSLLAQAHVYAHVLAGHSRRWPLPAKMAGLDLHVATEEALTALFARCAQNRRTLLALEDWHWSDAPSNVVVARLARVGDDVPLTVLLTGRPEFGPAGAIDAPWPTIHLAALDQAGVGELLAAHLGVTAPPDDFVRRIHERTGGNPFFIEELVDSMKEDGGIAVDGERLVLAPGRPVHLPSTVQAVIRSRLDRLPMDVRQVANVCAVLGRDFETAVVRELLGRDIAAAVRALGDLRLVHHTEIAPRATFRFKHSLTQEVAYLSMPAYERRQWHRQVAAVLEKRHEAGVDDLLEQLVFHTTAAESWDEAARFALAAAERAARLSQFREVLRLADEVLARRHEPESTVAARLLLLVERACEGLGLRERQQHVIDRILDLAATSHAPLLRAEGLRRQGELHALNSRFEHANEALGASLELSRQAGDAVHERNALRSLGFVMFWAGRPDDSLAYNERALAIDRQLGDVGSIATELTNIGAVLRIVGQHERAIAALGEAIAICDAHHVVSAGGYMHQILGNAYRDLGHLDAAAAALEVALELQTTFKLTVPQAFTSMTLANVRFDQGRMDDCLALYAQATETYGRLDYPLGVGNANLGLGDTLVRLGRPGDALPCYEAARRAYERLSDGPGAMRALEAAIGVHAALGTSEGVEALLSDAAALAERAKDFRKAGALLNSLGIHQWTRGRLPHAVAAYEHALRLTDERTCPLEAGLLLNSLGACHISLRRYEPAMHYLGRALALLRSASSAELLGHTLSLVGEIERELGDYDAALAAYSESLALRRQRSDRRGEAWMLQRMAAVHRDRCEPDTQEDLAVRAASIAAELDDATLASACRSLLVT